MGSAIKKKFFALGLGCIFLVLLLEILLSFGFKLFDFRQKSLIKAVDAKGKQVIRVLAVGESTTAVSANPEQTLLVQDTAYPVFLQQYLNEADTPYKFEVINTGIMGGDTSQIISDLRGNITKYKPHIVAALMGMKDYDKMKGSLEGPWSAKVSIILQRILNYSKIYKLIGLLRDQYSEENFDFDDSKEINSYEDMSRSLSKRSFKDASMALAKERDLFTNWSELRKGPLFQELIFAYYLLQTGQFERAEKHALDYIKKFDLGRYFLAEIYLRQNDFKRTMQVLERIQKEFPKNKYVVSEKLNLYVYFHKYKEADELIKKYDEAQKEFLSFALAKSQFYRQQKRYKQGAESLRPHCGVIPDENPYFAIALLKPAKYIKAVEHLTCHFYLGELYYHLNDFNNSQYHLEYLANSNYRDYSVIYLLLKIYRQLGETEKEGRVLKTAVKFNKRLGEYFELVNYFKHSGQNNQIPYLFEMAAQQLPHTANNFNELYQITKQNNADLILMQYPTFDIGLLKYFIKQRDDVLYVSNEHIFDNAPKKKYFFEPRYPYKFNHYTVEGAQVLAKNLAEHILKGIKDGKFKSLSR